MQKCHEPVRYKESFVLAVYHDVCANNYMIEGGIKARDRNRDPRGQGHHESKERRAASNIAKRFSETFLLRLFSGLTARDDHTMNTLVFFMSCVKNPGYCSQRKTQTYMNVNITCPQQGRSITTKTPLQPDQPFVVDYYSRVIVPDVPGTLRDRVTRSR